ncbi:MAG: DMT family transporter [Nitrososphaerales archaeon]
MKIIYWIMLIGVVVIFGSNFTAVRFGLRYSGPIAFSMLRAAIGSLIMVPFSLYAMHVMRKNRNNGAQQLLLPKSPKTFAIIALFGIASSTFFFGFWYAGESLVSASVSSVMVNTSPFFTIILAYLFLKGKIVRKQGIGLALGFLGTFLVATNGSLASFYGDWRGFALLLLSAFSFASGLIIYKRWLTRFEGFTLNAIQLFFAAIGLLVWVLVSDPQALSQIDYTNPTFLEALLYTAVFGSVVANLVWMALVRQRGPEWFSMWLFLNPVFGVIISSAVLGESLYPIQILGMILVAFSIYEINRILAKRAAIHSPALSSMK